MNDSQRHEPGFEPPDPGAPSPYPQPGPPYPSDAVPPYDTPPGGPQDGPPPAAHPYGAPPQPGPYGQVYGAPPGHGHPYGPPQTHPMGHGGPPPPAPGPYGAPPPPQGPYGGPPAPYAYGPPVPYSAEGITSHDDPTWALMAYIGQFIGGFIAPLVVYLARKEQSPFVRYHGAQALNLALTSLIITFGGIIVGFVTLGIGFIVIVPVMLVFGIAHLIYLILAGIRAGRRELYEIPKWLCWPMVR